MSVHEHAFKEALQAFNEAVLAPRLASWRNAGKASAELYSAAAQQGYFGLCLPTSLGGYAQERDLLGVLADGLRDRGVALALLLQSEVILGSIAEFATGSQARDFVTPGIAGQAIGALALNPEDIGANADALLAFGEAKPQGLVISGEHRNVLCAQNANYLLTLVRHGQSLREGLSAALVPLHSAGLQRSEPIAKMGFACADMSHIHWDKVQVANAFVLGEIGQGAAVLDSLRRRHDFVWNAIGAAICESLLATVVTVLQKDRGAQHNYAGPFAEQNAAFLAAKALVQAASLQDGHLLCAASQQFQSVSLETALLLRKVLGPDALNPAHAVFHTLLDAEAWPALAGCFGSALSRISSDIFPR